MKLLKVHLLQDQGGILVVCSALHVKPVGAQVLRLLVRVWEPQAVYGIRPRGPDHGRHLAPVESILHGNIGHPPGPRHPLNASLPVQLGEASEADASHFDLHLPKGHVHVDAVGGHVLARRGRRRGP